MGVVMGVRRVLGAAVVGLVAVAGCDAGEDSEGGGKPAQSSRASDPKAGADPKGDVEVSGCGVDEVTRLPEAELSVRNRSSERSSYSVQVEFVDSSGARLSEGGAVLNGLASGQKANEKVMGGQVDGGKVDCKVTGVDRWASSK